MDTIAIDKIKQVFQEDEFKVGIIEDEEVGYIEIKNGENLYVQTKNHVLDCTGYYALTFHFQNNSIHVQLERSGVIGSVLLNKMEEAVKTVPHIKYIRLIDGSHIETYGNMNYMIDLSLLHILTTGQSWYNSLGYKSINFDSEILHNKKKLEMPCEYFFRDVFGKSLKYYILFVKSQIKKKRLKELPDDEIRKQYRDEWNKIFEPINPETIFRGKTVCEFFIQLWQETKDVSEKWSTLRKILDYVYESKIIEYNTTLEKHIEHD